MSMEAARKRYIAARFNQTMKNRYRLLEGKLYRLEDIFRARGRKINSLNRKLLNAYAKIERLESGDITTLDQAQLRIWLGRKAPLSASQMHSRPTLRRAQTPTNQG
jgi:multidrug resistance efflux pump